MLFMLDALKDDRIIKMLSDSGKVFWTVLYCLEQKVGVTLAGLQQNGWQDFLTAWQ